MNNVIETETRPQFTLTTPAKCAPFDSMCSMYLEKSANSSQVGRNTMIRGTCELFFFGAIALWIFTVTKASNYFDFRSITPEHILLLSGIFINRWTNYKTYTNFTIIN